MKKTVKRIFKFIGVIASLCTILAYLGYSSNAGNIKLDAFGVDIGIDIGIDVDLEHTNETDNGFIETSNVDDSVPNVLYAAGQVIMTNNIEMYAAADPLLNPVRRITGSYYIYDGLVVDGFIRICPSIDNVGKKPLELNVTGWIKIADLK